MAVNAISGANFISPQSFGIDKLQGNEDQSMNFSDFLNSALNKVNDLQVDSQNTLNDFAAGKTDNIHQVMIASEKADIALQFTMQIRNKIMDAYTEIMRIQI